MLARIKIKRRALSPSQVGNGLLAERQRQAQQPVHREALQNITADVFVKRVGAATKQCRGLGFRQSQARQNVLDLFSR